MLLPRFLRFALFSSGLCLVACKREAPIDDAELGRRLDAAEKAAADHDAEWRAAIGDALAKNLGPRKDLGHCPVAMPMLDFEMTFASAQATLARVGLGDIIRPSAIAVVTPDQVPATSSLTARKVRFDAKDLRAHTDGVNQRDGVYLLAEAQKLADPGLWKWDALVVLDRERAAGDVNAAAGTFVSGATRGRVFLFDYATHRVACAADFDAKNSEQVTVSAPSKQELDSNARAKLESDLLAQTIKAAFKDLWVAGPREARDAGAREPGDARDAGPQKARSAAP